MVIIGIVFMLLAGVVAENRRLFSYPKTLIISNILGALNFIGSGIWEMMKPLGGG